MITFDMHDSVALSSELPNALECATPTDLMLSHVASFGFCLSDGASDGLSLENGALSLLVVQSNSAAVSIGLLSHGTIGLAQSTAVFVKCLQDK